MITDNELIDEIRRLQAIKNDWLKTLRLLDAMGIWTGADELAYDRVAAIAQGMSFNELSAEQIKIAITI